MSRGESWGKDNPERRAVCREGLWELRKWTKDQSCAETQL